MYFLNDCEGGGNKIETSSKEEAIKRAFCIIENDIIQDPDDFKATYHLEDNNENVIMSFSIET